MTTAKKKDPKKWKRIVASVKAGSKGGKPGQWSAIKAAIASKRYKKSGGGYSSKGPSKQQTSMRKWLDEDWQTSDKKPAIRKDKKGKTVTKRFLPKSAWAKLSAGEKAATNRVKVLGSKKGKQFVPNTKKAAQARRDST